MDKQKPEIIELLNAVEKKYGHHLRTTTDFDEFSLHLKSKYNYIVSTSTLKRLWGYVNDAHKPRTQTLDLLCRYIGFDFFSDFCYHLKTSTVYNSSFFSTKQIQTKDLQVGDHVEIGWAPNRYVLLRYEGKNIFQVLEAKESKLQKGDYFETACFLLGQPLLLSYIAREGYKTAPFIAGRNGGLTLINQVLHEQ